MGQPNLRNLIVVSCRVLLQTWGVMLETNYWSMYRKPWKFVTRMYPGTGTGKMMLPMAAARITSVAIIP